MPGVTLFHRIAALIAPHPICPPPGPTFPISAMAVWPRYGGRGKGGREGGGGFLQVTGYVQVNRVADAIAARPAAKRGRAVNRPFGKPESQLLERHDASDFDKLVL